MIDTGGITRTIAQIEVDFSNSMIESFFRSLKHNHLYKQLLDKFSNVEKEVNFYVNEHNTIIPHASLNGGTPLEVFTGNWNDNNIIDLKEKIKKRRDKRILENKSQNCSLCQVKS